MAPATARAQLPEPAAELVLEVDDRQLDLPLSAEGAMPPPRRSRAAKLDLAAIGRALARFTGPPESRHSQGCFCQPCAAARRLLLDTGHWRVVYGLEET